MFQELTNTKIHLKYTVCTVYDDIVQLQLCCVVVKQGVCMMNELHDKYTFVNKSNLNLNKSDLNSCIMLGFVLIFVCFTYHFRFV